MSIYLCVHISRCPGFASRFSDIQEVCLFVRLRFQMSGCVSVYISAYPDIRASAFLTVHPDIQISRYLSIRIFRYLACQSEFPDN